MTNKFQDLANEKNLQAAYSSTDNNIESNNHSIEVNDVAQQKGQHELVKESVSKSFGKVLSEQKSPERSSSSQGKQDATKVYDYVQYKHE